MYLVHGWGGWGAQLDAFVGPLTGGRAPRGRLRRAQPRRLRPRPRGAGSQHHPGLAHALAAVAAANGPVHAVIAHSLGATAAAYALDRGLAAGRQVFIAPMADPLPYTRMVAGRLGFGERTRTRQVIERRVGTSMSAFAVPAMAGRVATPPLLLVHDRHDTETGWSDSAAIARSWPRAPLHSTTGLGHRRILRPGRGRRGHRVRPRTVGRPVRPGRRHALLTVRPAGWPDG